MKLTKIKKIKANIEQKMFKKTIDGIALILLRMYHANQKTENPAPDFVQFTRNVINLSPEDFFGLPITPAENYDI